MPHPPIDVRPLPRGRTARRLTWEFLPPQLRAAVEGRLGSSVVDARSCDGGFTPGFASVLTGADGAQLFVKAANRKAQAPFAAAYLEEAHRMQQLGTGVPAPALRFLDDGDWVVLGYDAVDGRSPQRPWQLDELRVALDLAERIAETTRDADHGLAPLTDDLPHLVTGWEHVALTQPSWPHLEEATRLARDFAALPADRFVHADVRDDNILLTGDGGALACDWNWPALAPPWVDAVTLLVSAYGDGLDADPLLDEIGLTRDVPAEQVDAWLAALCGFMLESADQPVPSSSPYLRQHNAWYAAASWAWLADRRGW